MAHQPTAAGKSSFDLIDVGAFLSALELTPGTVLLDLACGAGNYAVEIARRLGGMGTVHALDLWEEGIDRLKLRAGSLGLDNVQASVVDVSKGIPLADASVDICLMATVLHDLIADGTHEGALSEVVRVLKPAGRLAVVEFKKMPGPPGPPEAIRLSPEALERVLAPLGFRQTATCELGAETYFSRFRREAQA